CQDLWFRAWELACWLGKSSQSWPRSYGETGSWPQVSAVYTSCLEHSSPGGMVAKASAQRRNTAGMGPLPRASAPQHAPALPELDRLIHERIRLGIVSALA